MTLTVPIPRWTHLLAKRSFLLRHRRRDEMAVRMGTAPPFARRRGARTQREMTM
ncbi:hypothetical protein BDN70DRAFT_833490 [Pholiota conissans]|uniref:Uncharacterized protein n=1 Tax=Pholiota conissans TaxID=109636 RepID=A0A9P6D1W8_9AGAR|nr:hypothetical protein BDN70DRAFT_833490 [Pholiota conissans]